jgi:hypothetical protein
VQHRELRHQLEDAFLLDLDAVLELLRLFAARVGRLE